MAVSSMLQLAPSLHNHGHFVPTPSAVSVRSTSHHRDAPNPANPESERTSPPLFSIAPENDTQRFELYETLEQLYRAARSGKHQVSNYIFHIDQRTKRWLYQTVFEALNHRPVVEEILNESGFYTKNFDLHSHEGLVHVITYDFLKNKFSIRTPGTCSDKVSPLVVRVADALRKHAVKLNATVARMRVKADAKSLIQLLPVDAQDTYLRALHHPHYARINMVKVANVSSEVLAKLIADGFSQVCSVGHVSSSSRSFFHGSKELVAFSPDCRGKVDEHPLVCSGQLILQDHSSYQLVERLSRTLEACSVPAHIVITNPGIEALHIASLLRDKGTVSVYGFDPVTSDHIQQKATLLGVNNIQLVQAPFSSLLATDSTSHTISLILCLPPSSMSTVINPVDFILQEGGLLSPSLFSTSKVASPYSDEQREMLAHALEFVDVQYLAYATHSVRPIENDILIRKVLETHSTAHHRYVPSTDQDEGLDFYLAILEKVPEEPLPTPSEVIARAIAGGILSGEGLTHVEMKKKKKKKAKKVFSNSDGIPMTIAAQKKVVQKKPPEVHVRAFRH